MLYPKPRCITTPLQGLLTLGWVEFYGLVGRRGDNPLALVEPLRMRLGGHFGRGGRLPMVIVSIVVEWSKLVFAIFETHLDNLSRRAMIHFVAALALTLASSNDLSAKRPNGLLLNLPPNTLRPNSQDSCTRETGFIWDSVATAVQDQTDLAALGNEPRFPRDQSSKDIEGFQVAEEETQMNFAVAISPWQVRLAVEKSRDPVRVGAEVCQENCWRTDFVVYIEVEFQVCE